MNYRVYHNGENTYFGTHSAALQFWTWKECHGGAKDNFLFMIRNGRWIINAGLRGRVDDSYDFLHEIQADLVKKGFQEMTDLVMVVYFIDSKVRRGRRWNPSESRWMKKKA